jgi:hypothetical protein
VIVGGGPAGLAPLLAASRAGRLEALLRAGLAVVEAGPRLGAGSLGAYAINSDSLTDTFLTATEGTVHPALRGLEGHAVTRALAAYRGGPAPLPLAAAYLGLIGTVLAGLIAAAPAGAVLTGHTALSTQRRRDGLWLTRLRDPQGQDCALLSHSVVLATGATQPAARLEREPVCGAPLLPRFAGRLVQSGEVLAQGGLDAVAARLRGIARPRIAILGGSQSALATAHALLRSALPLGEGAVAVLHRRPLRVTYNSAAEALAEGYDEFGPADVCPLSGRVFRLAGFRLESRELVLRARGLAGRPPEPRLRLHRIDPAGDPEAAAILAGADLIIAALGYRPRALPVFDAAGGRIALRGESLAMTKLVGPDCAVLDAAGRALPGLYGIGLAAGFVPSGALGGEPSFSGQANGLWLWQNDVGKLIVRALLGETTAAADVAAGAA